MYAYMPLMKRKLRGLLLTETQGKDTKAQAEC
jgi:hypothetical protein